MFYSPIYDDLFCMYAEMYDLPDWRLLKAQAIIESRLNPAAKSQAGAMGLMQFMPKTFDSVKENEWDDPYDPETSIKYGAKYLKSLLETQTVNKIQGGCLDRYLVALKCYNGGIGWIGRALKLIVGDISFLTLQDSQHILCAKFGYKKESLQENLDYPTKILNLYQILKLETKNEDYFYVNKTD